MSNASQARRVQAPDHRSPVSDQPGSSGDRLPEDRHRTGAADRPDPATATATAWHFRVVGHTLVPPGELINHPDNARGHPPLQREAVAAAIDELGFVGEILVSQRSGRILDGHLRVAEALRSGQPVVPVGWVDCQSDEEEAAILATHDPLGAMATADKLKLARLADKAQVVSDPLKKMLATLAAQRSAPDLDPDQPGGRIIGAAFGPQGGGRHLGPVGGLVYPLVVECETESDAETLLEALADDGHRAYLLPASPTSLGAE